MKVLCVFTNKYPYTTVEPYLESEVYHYGAFDKVYIFSLMVKKQEEKNKRDTPEFIEVIPIRNDKLGYVIGAVRAILDRNFYSEIKKLRKGLGISFRRILTLLIYISRAHVDSRKIYENLKNKSNDEDLLFYTYRFEYQPYTALLVKQKLHMKNIGVVSRAHRYDLYEERALGEYIPLRGYLLENLDFVYPCSIDGKRYLKEKFPLWKEKIFTRYLGTNDYGTGNYSPSDHVFRIVSCSNITKVKRLDRIIDVLSNIKKSREIEWVHFGSGEDAIDIQRLAIEKLENKVKTVFMGRKTNHEILSYYEQNEIDLFINLSDSEGIPVSIMEALSFGIPCIATDVGGTSEIIEDGRNGFLVDVNLENKKISDIVDFVVDMDENRYLLLRYAARKTWEVKFNAEKNYGDFALELMRIADDK